MERNQLILLIIGIIVAVFVGGTMALILLYGERQRNRLAEVGDIDEDLKREYISEHRYKPLRIAGKVLELIIALGLISLFTMALVAKANGDHFTINGQAVYVVRSGSMSKLNPDNPYHDLIVQNKWNNRFDVYDMVFVQDKPKEEGFALGDIVVYKKDDQLVIHRIVNIKTPSETPDHKYYYTCCGDANSYSDGYVYYEDIIGIYTKNKIPFVGVFVLWLQSPLGYVVIGIIVVYGIYSTYLEDSLNKVRNRRLVEIGYLVRRKKKHGGVKYYLNDNPSSSEPKSVENRTVNKNTKEPVVKFIRRDYVNMRRLTWYKFSKPSKSKFNCTNYRYKVMKCLNYRYICVKVTFECKGKDISKYLFLYKRPDVDDIARANKCIRYLSHSGKLNSYIRYHLRLYENKNK